MFSTRLSKIFGRLILLILLQSSISTTLLAKPEHANNIFMGLGPIFSVGAIGFAQIGSEFVVDESDKLRISVGPLLGLGFAQGFFALDIDGFIKFQHDFELSAKYSLGLYAKAPLGFSLAVIKGVGLGFNLGLIPGVEFYFDNSFGVFMELGFIHHSFFATKDVNLSSHTPAGIFNAGAKIKF